MEITFWNNLLSTGFNEHLLRPQSTFQFKYFPAGRNAVGKTVQNNLRVYCKAFKTFSTSRLTVFPAKSSYKSFSTHNNSGRDST